MNDVPLDVRAPIARRAPPVRSAPVLDVMRPAGSARPPGSIDTDALRLVVGLVVAFSFVGFAVLLSEWVIAVTTYLAAVLGSLAVLTAVLLWPERPRSEGNRKPFRR